MKKVLLLLALLPLFFTSCSKDDDELDTSLIEGRWGLIHSEGYNLNAGDILLSEWDYSRNPYSPSTGCKRIDIAKIDDNEYYLESFYWSSYSEEWRKDESYSMTISGNAINQIATKEGAESTIRNIISITETNLIIEEKQGSYYYDKLTYKRLN